VGCLYDTYDSIVSIKTEYAHFTIKSGYHLDDIVVVGDTGDIGQPQCHKCTKKPMKKRENKVTWHIMVGQCP